jgi:hypothetical protein
LSGVAFELFQSVLSFSNGCFEFITEPRLPDPDPMILFAGFRDGSFSNIGASCCEVVRLVRYMAYMDRFSNESQFAWFSFHHFMSEVGEATVLLKTIGK